MAEPFTTGFGRFNKTYVEANMIKIMILSVIAGAVSCGSSTSIAENTPPIPARSPSIVSKADTTAPSEVVAQFMVLVSSNEIEKAKAFFETESVKTADSAEKAIAPKAGADAGPTKLASLGLFSDRNYKLGKILSENIKGEKAEVKTELRNDHSESTQVVVFHLVLEAGGWLISDIEFVFDKPSEI
jgi:hypothetical protein